MKEVSNLNRRIKVKTLLCLLLTALSVSATLITLDPVTVTDNGTGTWSPFIWVPVTVAQYGGEVGALSEIVVTYSGHLESGFEWLITRDDGAEVSDLYFTLARSLYLDLDADAVPWGERVFRANEVRVGSGEWGVGTLLSQPSLVDSDFSHAVHFPVSVSSPFVGDGNVSLTLVVRNLIKKSHGIYYGQPEVMTALSNLQVDVTYVSNPEPHTALLLLSGLGVLVLRRRRSSIARI